MKEANYWSQDLFYNLALRKEVIQKDLSFLSFSETDGQKI